MLLLRSMNLPPLGALGSLWLIYSSVLLICIHMCFISLGKLMEYLIILQKCYFIRMINLKYFVLLPLIGITLVMWCLFFLISRCRNLGFMLYIATEHVWRNAGLLAKLLWISRLLISLMGLKFMLLLVSTILSGNSWLIWFLRKEHGAASCCFQWQCQHLQSALWQLQLGKLLLHLFPFTDCCRLFMY